MLCYVPMVIMVASRSGDSGRWLLRSCSEAGKRSCFVALTFAAPALHYMSHDHDSNDDNDDDDKRAFAAPPLVGFAGQINTTNRHSLASPHLSIYKVKHSANTQIYK